MGVSSIGAWSGPLWNVFKMNSASGVSENKIVVIGSI